MNRLFVVNKPIFVSSNNYMYHIKRKYGTKKVGFSGTLDPFATGCLIVATGTFTKFFQYLQKAPKVYRATMWLGVESNSLDIENVTTINEVKELDISNIKEIINSFKGKHTYHPPKYSAKKINGKKAYELAREDKEVNLKEIITTVYDIKLLNYNHPFLSFEISVSEGGYIRSLAQIIADKLKIKATLSSLERVSEGMFKYENEKALNPYEYLKISKNIFLDDYENINLGKKLSIGQFDIKSDGVYLVESDAFYSIIEIKNGVVKYRLNRLPKEWSK